MQEKKISSIKIPELNWIRGIAALLIVLYHYTTRYQEVLGYNEGWNVNFFYGCGAVNIFFILSGFLTSGFLTAMTIKAIGWTSQLFILIPITISIILAWGIWYFVERPAVRFLATS